MSTRQTAISSAAALHVGWLLLVTAPTCHGEPLSRCNDFNDAAVTWAAVRAGSDQPLPLYSLEPRVLLPDGTEFKTWEQPAEHQRTFCVAQKDPKSSVFELTTRELAFAPEKAGLGFIRVAGFTVEYVASVFPIPRRGAISTRQGHHWIIENNAVRQVNSLGIDCGRRISFIPYVEPEDTPKLAGAGNIVRRNALIDCGICGLSGMGLVGCLLEDNYFSGCGWHNVEGWYANGGIKVLWTKYILVRRNVVHGTIGAPGIWMDHSNVNCRLTQNIVTGVRSGVGGVFLEATYRPVMFDHNVIWGCAGNGFYQHNCSDLAVVNNLIGSCSQAPVYMSPDSGTREVDIETNRMSVAVRNFVCGNVFYGFGERGPVMPGGNVSDYNLFVNAPGEKAIDLAAWRRNTGLEKNSAAFQSSMEFLLEDGATLRQLPLLPDFKCPRIFEMTTDYFGTPLPAYGYTQGGLFLATNQKSELRLLRNPLPVEGVP